MTGPCALKQRDSTDSLEIHRSIRPNTTLMTTLQFHERAADSWLLWNETVLSNSKHNYIGQNVNPRPQLPVVTTNPKAIAVEEANLVASPKCFLKYSKVCGWTFGTEPGGSSELEKFLPVLELFFLISWPTCLWGCYCTKKENFRWMLENSTYKRGNILIGAAKEQAEWCREVIFGSLRPRAPLQKYCFPAHHLFSRPFCQKKKKSATHCQATRSASSQRAHNGIRPIKKIPRMRTETKET